MNSEHLQEQAALYATGALTADERAQFELLLECDPELQKFTKSLLETAAVASLAATAKTVQPPPELKERILAALVGRVQQPAATCFVMTDARGLVKWANPAFFEMCGYTLDEVRGRKPGALLQGPKTDSAAVQRIRTALREERGCQETIVNYHKDGHPYWVEVSIEPFRGEGGRLEGFVAREIEIFDRPLAA